MQAIDGPTLLIILIAGFYLGLLGIFGFDFIDWSIGDHYKRWIFALVGLSAVWQFTRQRWE